MYRHRSAYPTRAEPSILNHAFRSAVQWTGGVWLAEQFLDIFSGWMNLQCVVDLVSGGPTLEPALLHEVVELGLRRFRVRTQLQLDEMLSVLNRRMCSDQVHETATLLMLEGADSRRCTHTLDDRTAKRLIARGIYPPHGIPWHLTWFLRETRWALFDAVCDAADLSEDTVGVVLSYLW